jgi:hypothetical protein
MDRRAIAGGLGCVMAVVACSTMPAMKVETDHDPAAASRLGSYRTYRWLDASSAPPPLAASMGPTIVRSVDETLGEKGYRQEASRPDFLVKWHVTVADKTRTTTVESRPTFRDPRAMPSTASPSTPVKVTSEYREGTLILDVVDGAWGTVVWRGSAEAELAASASPETREARVREALHRILDRFPPK